MGQQQILLIVLTVVLVGIAIVVGTQLFRAQAADSNLDAVCADLIIFANRAQLHYRRPLAMGGGGESFALLTANSTGMTYLTTSPTNDNGAYSISVAGTATSVTLQGIGLHDADRDGIYAIATVQVWPDSTNMTVINR
ncbi:MAG: hypothetical protein OEV08_15125 [Nitrospira sp.]|nr:hypothetical protein [Nitrospira sp.]